MTSSWVLFHLNKKWRLDEGWQRVFEKAKDQVGALAPGDFSQYERDVAAGDPNATTKLAGRVAVDFALTVLTGGLFGMARMRKGGKVAPPDAPKTPAAPHKSTPPSKGASPTSPNPPLPGPQAPTAAPPRTLQSGGSTIDRATAKDLGLTPAQANQKMHALKKANGIPNNVHEHKIMDNGDVVNRNTGEVIDNLFNY